jgi:hypothetical protein
MRRLFPVPFRLIERGQQFKKWQWIETLIEKAPADHRRESHKIYVGHDLMPRDHRAQA